MSRILTLLAVGFLLASPLHADEIVYPDSGPAYLWGGLQIICKGNQTMVSIGGNLVPRSVRITTQTPDGPVVTRLQMPATARTGIYPPLPEIGRASACLIVEIPDPDAVVYVAGELVPTHGMVRILQSPPLQRGVSHPLHVRAAYKIGDNMLIEDRHITIRAAEKFEVHFDGSKALIVPLKMTK